MLSAHRSSSELNISIFTEDLVITTLFGTKDFAAKSNLLL